MKLVTILWTKSYEELLFGLSQKLLYSKNIELYILKMQIILVLK